MPAAFFRGYWDQISQGEPERAVSSTARSPASGSPPSRRTGPTSRSYAQKADREGNVPLEGIVGVQKEAVLAARRSLVTVEEIVDAPPRTIPTPSSCRRGR